MVLCNPTIYCGTYFTTTFFWEENGAAVDLTEYQAQATSKNSVTSFSWSSGAGQITLGLDGSIITHLDEAFTRSLSPGTYVWDILLQDGSGNVLAPKVAGVITVIQGSTVWQ